MSFYPIYLTRIEERDIILLGGDEEAERKSGELIDFGARLTVISPHITDTMKAWQRAGKFHWIPRKYEYGDLEGAYFAIAAEYDEEIGEMVAKEARDRNILINVMDNIPLSDAAFGSLFTRGKLTVSMSSNGLAPALIVRLKEKLQNELDEAYGEFLQISQQIRGPIMEQISDSDTRKKMWYEWVDSETLPLLKAGKRDEALRLTQKIWGKKIMKAAGLSVSTGLFNKLLGKG